MTVDIKFEQIPAKHLAVGVLFVKYEDRADAEVNDWAWRVLAHDLTGRGDYSTIVECDGSDWTERFGPDEPVWLVTSAASPSGDTGQPAAPEETDRG